MYLGRLATFKKIEATFEEVIKKITDLKPRETQNFAETREQLLAQAYMKLGNCYLGESNDEDFRRYKNLDRRETLPQGARSRPSVKYHEVFASSGVIHA